MLFGSLWQKLGMNFSVPSLCAISSCVYDERYKTRGWSAGIMEITLNNPGRKMASLKANIMNHTLCK
jgi:hypothetical protein